VNELFSVRRNLALMQAEQPSQVTKTYAASKSAAVTPRFFIEQPLFGLKKAAIGDLTLARPVKGTGI
jgi:hypothetical protein